MPFDRPKLEDIRLRVKSDIETRLGVGPLLSRSTLKVLADVMGGAAHLLHGHLDYVSRQVFVDSAEAENLARHASIWGVARKPASFAAGSVEVTGTNGVAVPTGVKLRRSDGTEYSIETTASVSGGTAQVDIKALTAGEVGNASAGITLNFVNPQSGLDGQVTVIGDGVTGGVDIESDELLRQRVLNRIQEPPHGGASFDYEGWALEVAGVTRAFIFPQNRGPGTVDVAIVDDNSDPIIPGTAKVNEVQTYIDQRRPVTADVSVFAPNADPVNFDISITPDNPDIRQAIENSLSDLFRRDAEPNGTIFISRIREAISIAAGEFNHTLNSPTADITTTSNDISTLGTITWT